MHFSAKCNSCQIAIQWFHIKHYLDYQYTKFQPYTFGCKNVCFCTIREFGSPDYMKLDIKETTLSEEYFYWYLNPTTPHQLKKSWTPSGRISGSVHGLYIGTTIIILQALTLGMLNSVLLTFKIKWSFRKAISWDGK